MMNVPNPLNLADVSTSAILDSLPDGAYVTDTTRRILFWNREAENMTGWKRDDVIGHRCKDNILCHIDKDGHPLCGHDFCPLHRAMVTGTSSDHPRLLFAKRQDGSRIPVEVTVAPIRNPEGQIIGGIEIFRDLSSTHQDLNRARLIQQSSMALESLPDARFRIAMRYSPHNEVGGDFYRGARIRDNLYAILMADVVGHGISAALYAMQLRILWDEGQPVLDDPAAFLTWLSNKVRPLTDTDAGYFATAIHMVYDASNGTLRIGTAGHPAPLVIRKNNRLDELTMAGPGLGLIPDPHFKIATATLDAGDHLLLFTDGALEIDNAAGDELGREQFKAFVLQADFARGDQALSHLEDDLLHYTNGLFLPDDLTLIDLERIV